MKLFVEQPLALGVFGGILVIVFVATWFATRNKAAMYCALGCVAITGILILVERLIVTDYEAVRDTIEAVSLAVEENDAEEVNKYIHEDSEHLKHRVDSTLRTFTIKAINRRRGLKLKYIEDQIYGQRLESRFSVIAIGKQGRDTGRVPIALKVTFLKSSDDKWKVSEVDYQLGIRPMK